MIAISETATGKRRIPLQDINIALLIFLVLYAAIALIQPNYP